LIRQRDYERAEEALVKALELKPEHYMANFNLLQLYSRTRNPLFEEQKQFFEEIKEKRWQQLTQSLRIIEVVPH
jgi:hypothetical protein